jgi:CubicO group peptidase (beta-lactamase class C family)
MTKSSFDLGAIDSEGRMQDVATAYDQNLAPRPHRRDTATAAVGLYATPKDLARFVLAFTRENPVLAGETLTQMLTPQPGTSGTWGLGHTLFVENDAGGYVTGHDGGAIPAWGSMVRVNPATGNGFVLVVSGGRGAVNQLVHDWVYWETGKITPEGRRQIIYDRLFKGAGLAAIILGAIAIALWKMFR